MHHLMNGLFNPFSVEDPSKRRRRRRRATTGQECKSEFMGLCIGLAITSVEQYFQLRSHVKALYNNNNSSSLAFAMVIHYNRITTAILINCAT